MGNERSGAFEALSHAMREVGEMKELTSPSMRLVRLHVSLAVLDWLKTRAEAEADSWIGPAWSAPYVAWGTPVHVDPALTGGQWSIRVVGGELAGGDVAPPSGPDRYVTFVRGAGWIEADMVKLGRMVGMEVRDGE